MKSKYENIRCYLHYLPRSIAFRMLDNYDLTEKERDILKHHELDHSITIKELASKYAVEERCILRTKQVALKKVLVQFLTNNPDTEESLFLH